MKSFWNKDEKCKFESLEENLNIDVCIVGAGLSRTINSLQFSKSRKNSCDFR